GGGVGGPRRERDAHRLEEEVGPGEAPASPGERGVLEVYLTMEILELFRPACSVLPLVAGCGVPTVYELLCKRLARDFDCPVEESKRDIAAVLGMPLSEWLLTRFFRQQVRYWNRGPFLWQLQSRPARRGAPPAFACLVYYHRLNGDTLREIRENLVAPLGVSSLNEFTRALERVEKEG